MPERDARQAAMESATGNVVDNGAGTPPVTEAQPGSPKVLNEEVLVMVPRSLRRGRGVDATNQVAPVPAAVAAGSPSTVATGVPSAGSVAGASGSGSATR